jgi:hypothetical protein
VSVVGDNIEWTYNLTVPAGQTVRLESFTIVATTRAAAIASANALVTGTGFGGQAAAFLSPSELGSLANFMFVAAPQVVGVAIAGSTWTSSSLAGGYTIPVGSGAQLLTLPAANIDQIKVTFNENVVVDQTDLLLTGVNVPSYNVSGGTFSYDPVTFTATWTLPQPIGPDKLMLMLNADGSDPIRDLAGNSLDGEWTNPTSTADTGTSIYPSGDGVAGGNFQFRLNVLPGDADLSGTVNFSDLSKLLASYGTTSGATWGQGDFTGDGAVNFTDLSKLLAYYGKSLPSGEPAAGSFPTNVLLVAASVPTAVPSELVTPEAGSTVDTLATTAADGGALDGSAEAATPAVVLLETACTQPLAVTVKTVASAAGDSFQAAAAAISTPSATGAVASSSVDVSAAVNQASQFVATLPAVSAHEGWAGVRVGMPTKGRDSGIDNQGQGETPLSGTWEASSAEGKSSASPGPMIRADQASALAAQSRVHDAVLDEELSDSSPRESLWISDVAHALAGRADDLDCLTDALDDVLTAYHDA